ncbi:hypothetical protein L227DRAFT_617913 [Lentinus tigrinus ALCF2SS1-6]|uniref:Uncharacterized protein n=1 Tax=Lentinus tigrinus ALCF2SS1-6 TaxID=1328759 RepID=A0A5C2RMC0_9APHY|nr:hypothetical protein L227DRAFT_617913 [Lentinus tigrinus ALCF2SS1-6]
MRFSPLNIYLPPRSFTMLNIKTKHFFKVSLHTHPPLSTHPTDPTQVIHAITTRSNTGRHSIKWTQLTSTLRSNFNCDIKHVAHNKYKVIPPPPGHPNWPFPQTTLHIYKPQNDLQPSRAIPPPTSLP